MHIEHLRTLHRTDPLGIDQTPEFSWIMISDQKDTFQTCYRIQLRTADGTTVWDTREVKSDQQSFIEYSGPILDSRTSYHWEATVKDNHGHTATASATFETAFLDEDWTAKWVESTISRPEPDSWAHGTQPPAVQFLRYFDLSGDVRRARLYATCLGVYEVEINGSRPDDRELAPEFSVYKDRLYYQTYDVTTLLRPGRNSYTMYVGDGWYFCPQTRPLGETLRSSPAVIFQLEVEYVDGTLSTISSDGTENCRTGPVRSSDLYWGERFDSTVGPSAAQPVRVVDLGFDNLVAQPIDPIRPMAFLPAVDLYTSPYGDTIVDFGQVLAGRARVLIDAPAGREVSFEYFEVTTADGGYFNSMIAGQKDVYVSDGTAHKYEPRFTFYGFRYIRVTGMPSPKKEDFTAVHLTSPKQRTGKFASSDRRLNRLHENVRWSQSNNMMSIPTDCPTREKAGFTGDIQLYAPTALSNEDMTAFLTAWLRNVAAEQRDNGVVPMTVPFTAPYERLSINAGAEFGDTAVTGIAGWSDAVVIVPHAMYQATGNEQILREMYPAMKAWGDYVIATAREQRGRADIAEEIDRHLWNTGFHFGEWLIPSQENTGGDFEVCKISASYVAPFFGYHSVKLLASISEILGYTTDTSYYGQHASAMREAIHATFMAGPELPTELMGAYVLAFAFDLVPDEKWDSYAQCLVELIKSNDGLLNTGFLATPYLLDVLINIGRRDLATSLLWEDRQPSWLYQVDMGATAIWENWDALDSDRNPKISSFNHYAFGCVDDWICREVAGIKAGTAGYKHAIIAPQPDPHLSFCERNLLTEFGEIAVRWDQQQLDVRIPCNTTATITWGDRTHQVGSGRYTF